MTAPPKHVIIVGAGLGGTALSLALAQRSIPSTIYELRETRGDIGGAVALAPNAARVLDRLGVWPRIRDSGYQYENMRFVNEAGSLIGDYANGGVQRYGYPAVRVPRTAVLKALHEEATRKGIEIRFSKKAVRVEQDEASVTVHFADGTRETADLLVGFDGIHSGVRAAVMPEIQSVYTGFTGIGGYAPKSRLTFPTENYELPVMIIGQKGAFALMPSDPKGENVGCFSSCYMKVDKTREEWADFAKTEALPFIVEKHQAWPEPVKSMMAALEPTQVHIWPTYELPAVPHWHKGRVVLAGDAVHAMSPHAGQGSAQAFEDGALLARALAMVSPDCTLETALERWEAKRKARVAYVVEFAHTSSNTRKDAGWVAEVVKEWGMWAFFKLKGATQSRGLNEYDVDAVDLTQ